MRSLMLKSLVALGRKRHATKSPSPAKELQVELEQACKMYLSSPSLCDPSCSRVRWPWDVSAIPLHRQRYQFQLEQACSRHLSSPSSLVLKSPVACKGGESRAGQPTSVSPAKIASGRHGTGFRVSTKSPLSRQVSAGMCIRMGMRRSGLAAISVEGGGIGDVRG